MILKVILCLLCITSMMVLLYCENPVFDNPVDPYSSTFSQCVLVNDFNHGSFSEPNLWGYRDTLPYTGNGGIASADYVDESGTGRRDYAFRIEFDVTQADSSYCCWYQRLGYP